MLIAQGAHPRAMMERLGHSTIQVTLGTYGHLFPNLEESLDHALNSVFEGAAAPTPSSWERTGMSGPSGMAGIPAP